MVPPGGGSGQPARNVDACGSYYSQGDGVERDEEKALDFFEKAAELGEANAFFFSGLLLMKRGEMENAICTEL